MIKILNYRDNCKLNHPLVVIFGQINLENKEKDHREKLIKCKYLKEDHNCLIAGNENRFKFIFLLQNGLNQFEFNFKQKSIKLNLIFKGLSIKKCIKPFYVICSNKKGDRLNSIFEDGRFQSKDNLSNQIENAKRRISIALLMLQSFVAALLPNRITFNLDLDDLNYPKIKLFHSEFSLDEFKKMDEEEL